MEIALLSKHDFMSAAEVGGVVNTERRHLAAAQPLKHERSRQRATKLAPHDSY